MNTNTHNTTRKTTMKTPNTALHVYGTRDVKYKGTDLTFDADYTTGTLFIYEEGHTIAIHAPGHWHSIITAQHTTTHTK